MSTQATPSGHDGTDQPARSDGFVRGISEAIGGPLGEHARHRRPRQPVLDGDPHRARARLPGARPALGAEIPLSGRRLAEQLPVHPVLLHRRARPLLRRRAQRGEVPYRDHPVEYPVADRYFMGAIGLPVHAVGDANPQMNQVQGFYNINAVVLSALAVGHGGGDPGAAPPPPLGRGDLRPRARAGADRHRQLGLPRHRARAAGHIRLGAPAAGAGGRPARPGRRGEDVAAVHPRADPGAGTAGAATTGRAHRARLGPGDRVRR